MKRPAQKLIKTASPPKPTQKTMKRLNGRPGVGASRTPLAPEVREVTVTFTTRTYQKLELAAHLSGISTKAMVRQCVQYLLDPRDA